MKAIFLLLSLIISFSIFAEEIDTAPYIKTSKEAIQEFAVALKTELQAGFKAGGATAAVSVCNTKAPVLALETSQKYGAYIGRTSLKIRNADNRPDSWEKAVLQQFETRLASGEDVNSLVHYEVTTISTESGDKSVFRFMKAIPTAGVCLTCHGTDIDENIVKTLDQYYPNDKARGFDIGSIRGAFTVIQFLE